MSIRSSLVLLVAILISPVGIVDIAAAQQGTDLKPQRLLVWGSNRDGEFGRATTDEKVHSTPYFVPKTENVSSVALGHGFTATLSDGRIDLTTNNRWVAPKGVEFPPLTMRHIDGIRSLAAGEDHILAVRNDGSVVAWGSHTHGQLGIGRMVPGKNYAWNPLPVVCVKGASSVAAARFHSYAILDNGTVMAWGNNAYGQLGIGAAGGQTNPTPTQIPGLTKIKSIAAGYVHTLALDTDGNVYAWGLNSHGQVGTGDDDDRRMYGTPQKLPFGSKIAFIAAGRAHSLAVDIHGSVYGWGCDEQGQLDGDDDDDWYRPQPLRNIPAMKSVAAGVYHSLALTAEGTVWGWGVNGFGELGNGAAGSDSEEQNPVTPRAIFTDPRIESIYARDFRSAALIGICPCDKK